MAEKWTAADIPDQIGKVVTVTGANTGLGYIDAQELARRGAEVILACRDKGKGEAALRKIKNEQPEAKAELMLLDLADLASVRNFADEFTSKYDKLDILINNAGLMFPPYMKTVDGFEIQFGTNHLGHFALTGLLMEHIIKTPEARVVTVSSGAHKLGGRIHFDDLNWQKKYSKIAAYSQSKLANLLFTFELQKRFEGAGLNIIAVAAHPGMTATELGRYTGLMNTIANKFIAQKAEIGALPTLYAATAPDVGGGAYYGPGGIFEARGYPKKAKIDDRARDADVAARLWKVSEEMTGVKYDQLDKNVI
jgi:NAD(P)-dependent dehydrogenase (short-subunit alcohol dehydrogenase family)